MSSLWDEYFCQICQFWMRLVQNTVKLRTRVILLSISYGEELSQIYSKDATMCFAKNITELCIYQSSANMLIYLCLFILIFIGTLVLWSESMISRFSACACQDTYVSSQSRHAWQTNTFSSYLCVKNLFMYWIIIRKMFFGVLLFYKAIKYINELLLLEIAFFWMSFNVGFYEKSMNMRLPYQSN